MKIIKKLVKFIKKNVGLKKLVKFIKKNVGLKEIAFAIFIIYLFQKKSQEEFNTPCCTSFNSICSI